MEELLKKKLKKENWLSRIKIWLRCNQIDNSTQNE